MVKIICLLIANENNLIRSYSLNKCDSRIKMLDIEQSVKFSLPEARALIDQQGALHVRFLNVQCSQIQGKQNLVRL